MTALHAGVVEVLARDGKEVERARGLAGCFAAPRAVSPCDEVGMRGVAAEFIREFLRDADLIRRPMVDRALIAERLSHGRQETDRGVVGIRVEPLDVAERGAGSVDDVAAPLEGDLTVRTRTRRGGQGAAGTFEIEEEERVVLRQAVHEPAGAVGEFFGTERLAGAHGEDLTFLSGGHDALADDVLVFEVSDTRGAGRRAGDVALDQARLGALEVAEAAEREEVVLRTGLGTPAGIVARGLARDVELAVLTLQPEHGLWPLAGLDEAR